MAGIGVLGSEGIMKIERKKVKADMERRIVIGMIVSTPFLRSIKPIFRTEYLRGQCCETVAKWCVDFYEKYERAPNKEIQDIFFHQQRNGLDGAISDLVENLLSSLSDEFEHADRFNADYLYDQTIEFFKKRSLENLSEDINYFIESGDLTEAERSLLDYKKPEKILIENDNPFGAPDKYKKAFENKEEPLFKLPGILGDMVNPHLTRGAFLALLGRAKIGKTWRMQDMAFRAVKERCNTVYFQMGDLTTDDFILRQAVYISGKSWDPRYCGELLIPVLDCIHNQRGPFGECPFDKASNNMVLDGEEVDLSLIGRHEPCTYCLKKKGSAFQGTPWWEKKQKVDPLTWREAYRADRVWTKRHRIKDRFRLKSYANSTTNVRDLQHQLDLWEEVEGFVADVVFIDYADIMAPEDPRKERRHQEDDRWRALRRLSQERHVLTITATQSNREGFDEDTVKATHASEDKRKLDHVTALFSLNQTEKEEEQGIVRFANTGIVREGRANRGKQVCVLQSIETGKPYIASYYRQPKKKQK